MPADRSWQLDGDPFMVEPDALEMEIHMAAGILSRVGGVVLIAAQREEVAPDHYLTTGYAFTWRSYAPAKRMEAEPEFAVGADAIPDPADVLA